MHLYAWEHVLLFGGVLFVVGYAMGKWGRK
jgi:hypothetical protein